LKTDPTRLVSACRRLANQGKVAGQLNLGFLYETGRGVPQNHAEAMRWWRAAADEGDARARTNLKLMSAMGWRAVRDHAAPPIWQEKAAEASSTIPKNVRNAPDIEFHDAAVVTVLGKPAQSTAPASPHVPIAGLGMPQNVVKADIGRLPKWLRVRNWM